MNQGKRAATGLLSSAMQLTLVIALPAYCAIGQRSNLGPKQRHHSTEWQVASSFKFDLLCFVNLLTGDPFYQQHYQEEYLQFAPRLTPAARAALSELKRKVKDNNRNIISAFLSLHFSATDDETIDEMLQTLEQTGPMRRTLRGTAYFNAAGWRLFDSVRGDLKTVFLFLKSIGFDDYWRQNILPKVQLRITELEKELPKYNVVSEVEAHLGYALPSNKITVFVLNYSRPHGIRITGTRFLCDLTYPLKVILQTASHEMMHPPYDLEHDPELRRALNGLRSDPFLMDKVAHHNPSFGYNSFEAFIEENCVRALDQLIGERLKISGDAGRRWKAEDDGMHVFAVSLYSLLRQENYVAGKESFRDFLIRTIRSGKLGPGNIKPTYDAFYSSASP